MNMNSCTTYPELKHAEIPDFRSGYEIFNIFSSLVT